MKMYKNDSAIDSETLGKSRAKLPAIVEIGAVAFDRESGKIQRELHVQIDLVSAVKSGHVDGETLTFWFSQPNAQQAMTRGARVHLNDALLALSSFVTPGDSRIWSWGSDFDVRILGGAFEQSLLMEWPWDYRATRDARTYCTELAEQFGIVLPIQSPIGKHNALMDARHCAHLVSGVHQQMMVLSEACA